MKPPQSPDGNENSISPLVEDDILVALFGDQLNPHPYPFKSFLKALKERLGLVTAGIDIGIGDEGLPPVSIFYHPVSEIETVKLFTASQQLWRAYPVKPKLKMGDIYTLDQLLSPSEFARNPYIRVTMSPFQVVNELVMAFSGPEKVMCLLRLGIDAKTRCTDAHIHFVKQLRPHLEIALQAHMLIRRPAAIVDMLTSMTNVLDIGVFILDGHKRLIYQNKVAETFVNDGSCISIVGDKIAFTKNGGLNKQIADFFESALRWRYKGMTSLLHNSSSDHVDIPGIVFRVDRDDGSYLDLLAQPIRTFIPYRNETSPQLVVYAVDSRRQIAAPVGLVMQLYGLTHTEAQLALMMANGSSIASAGTTLGLTEGTARTYSKRIYAKLGIERQAALAQMLHRSVLFLAKSK